MSRQAIYAVCMAAVLVLSSCEHKDLCYNHPEHALRSQTRIEAAYNRMWEVGEDGEPAWMRRWPDTFGFGYETLVPDMPEGLCVNAYSADGSQSVSHIAATGGIVSMKAGDNSLLMYNDDTEFIIFDRLNASVSAKATTRSRSRSSYSGNPFYAPGSEGSERTVTPPDPLFGHYIEHYEQPRLQQPPSLAVTLQPLVFTYVIRYEFEQGIEYVGIARGALAGMAVVKEYRSRACHDTLRLHGGAVGCTGSGEFVRRARLSQPRISPCRAGFVCPQPGGKTQKRQDIQLRLRYNRADGRAATWRSYRSGRHKDKRRGRRCRRLGL